MADVRGREGVVGASLVFVVSMGFVRFDGMVSVSETSISSSDEEESCT